MAFDGLVTSALTHELNAKLKGGKIERIHQPVGDELFFVINSNREKYTLFICSNSGNPRIYLTDEKPQNPAIPPSFCMLLRKHLMGGRIEEITQHDSDRIIEIHIVSSNELSVKEPKKLIIEIMGKHSNIILTDSQTGIILDSIKHVTPDKSRERQILPKLEYIYPPSQGKLSFSQVREENFAIDKIQGLSPTAKTELMIHENPYERLNEMVRTLNKGNGNPIIYYDHEDKPVEFYVLPLSEYKGAKFRTWTGISEMLAYYYSRKESGNRIKQKSADLLKVLNRNINKLRLKKQRLSEDLQKAEKGHTYRLYGELITANLYQIEKGRELVTLSNYNTGEDTDIVMNPLISPSENAQAYFKKYNKSKTAKAEKKLQLKDTDENIHSLESYVTYIENAETVEEIDMIRTELVEQGYLKKKKNQPAQKRKKMTFLRFEVYGGFVVYVGRNNRENDELTMKKAASRDIWFHTKDIPGSHVILVTDGQNPHEKTIFETAAIAAYYSKARESQNVPVDYTRIKHVKKPSGAKPGMVIFTDNKTVYADPRNPSIP